MSALARLLCFTHHQAWHSEILWYLSLHFASTLAGFPNLIVPGGDGNHSLVRAVIMQQPQQDLASTSPLQGNWKESLGLVHTWKGIGRQGICKACYRKLKICSEDVTPLFLEDGWQESVTIMAVLKGIETWIILPSSIRLTSGRSQPTVTLVLSPWNRCLLPCGAPDHLFDVLVQGTSCQR